MLSAKRVRWALGSIVVIVAVTLVLMYAFWHSPQKAVNGKGSGTLTTAVSTPVVRVPPTSPKVQPSPRSTVPSTTTPPPPSTTSKPAPPPDPLRKTFGPISMRVPKSWVYQSLASEPQFHVYVYAIVENGCTVSGSNGYTCRTVSFGPKAHMTTVSYNKVNYEGCTITGQTVNTVSVGGRQMHHEAVALTCGSFGSGAINYVGSGYVITAETGSEVTESPSLKAAVASIHWLS